MAVQMNSLESDQVSFEPLAVAMTLGLATRYCPQQMTMKHIQSVHFSYD